MPCIHLVVGHCLCVDSRYVYNLIKYEFDLQFELPVTYPATAPELELPELDGKTAKVSQVATPWMFTSLRKMASSNAHLRRHVARETVPDSSAEQFIATWPRSVCIQTFDLFSVKPPQHSSR